MSRWSIIWNISFILTNELLHPNPPVITFYFDLGSPYAYLAAERLSRLLPEPVRWQPVLLGGLFKLSGRSSWALGDERRRTVGMAEIERRVRTYGLPPMRWPDPWPDDYLTVMRATTYAFATGRGHEFAMQAFRDAFAAGSDLSIPANVFASARRAGLDAGRGARRRGRSRDQAPAARRHRRGIRSRRVRRAHDRDRRGAVLGR